MKTLWLLPFLIFCSCRNESTVSSSGDLKREFQNVCATYRENGFEARLAEIFPVGANTTEVQELLSMANKRKDEAGTTVYIFDHATGAFSDQGLVVFISVDERTKQINTVRSAVAAN